MSYVFHSVVTQEETFRPVLEKCTALVIESVHCGVPFQAIEALEVSGRDPSSRVNRTFQKEGHSSTLAAIPSTSPSPRLLPGSPSVAETSNRQL